jgi:hypothetical protein
MTIEQRGTLDLRTATADQINQAMTLGTIEALRQHQEAGHSVVVWDREHDRIVIVPPDEITLPEGSPPANGPESTRKRPVADPAATS